MSKTYKIGILASITESTDKTGQDATPVVVNIEVSAESKVQAEQIFAKTMKKLIEQVKSDDELRTLREIVKQLESQEKSRKSMMPVDSIHTPPKRYSWEEKKSYREAGDYETDYNVLIDKKGYGPEHF